MLKRCGLLVVTGGVLLGTFAPAATVGAQQYNLNKNKVWSYETSISPDTFNSKSDPCDIEEYLVTINPSLVLTDDAKAAIERLEAKARELAGIIADKLEIKIDIIEDAIFSALADILSHAAGHIDDAIDDLLTNTLPGVIENIVYRFSLPGATEDAASDFETLEAGYFSKATQDTKEWQDAVDALEAPGGVVSQITSATNSFNTALNSNSYIRGLFTFLNVPDPVTNEWMIGNIGDVASIINGVDCSNWLISLAGATAACNTVKAEVKTVSDNLADYQAYKDLLANAPADPAAWALEQALSNTNGCNTSMTRDECITEVAEKNAQSQADSVVLAYQLALPIIKNYVPNLQDYVDDVVAKIAECYGVLKEEAAELLSAILNWKYNNLNTPIDLTLSTFTNGQRIGGDKVYNLTLSQIVDLLMGRATLDSYTVSIPADAFVDNVATLKSRIGLQFGHKYILLGKDKQTVSRICIAEPELPISPIIEEADDKLSTPLTGVKSEEAVASDSYLAIIGLFSVVLIASVGVVRFSTNKR